MFWEWIIKLKQRRYVVNELLLCGIVILSGRVVTLGTISRGLLIRNGSSFLVVKERLI